MGLTGIRNAPSHRRLPDFRGRPIHDRLRRRPTDPHPVRDVRIAGRNTRGVWIFRVAEGEKIVSVARIEDEGDEGDEDKAAMPT